MKEPSRAPVYAFMMPLMSKAAQSVGYALALHGSMGRDMDVVAIPWTAKAKAAPVVMRSIRDALGALLVLPARGPVRKPHGRQAWRLYLHDGFYVDLSVMPRRRTS